MKFTAHLAFGIFTGLLVYYLTNNFTAAMIVFLGQIILVLDFIFKKIIMFEPGHSLLAMFGIWAISLLFLPAYHWFVLFAYFSHLFLDLFVEEEIPLLYPSKKKLTYPIEHSELFVIVISVAGSIVLAALIMA